MSPVSGRTILAVTVTAALLAAVAAGMTLMGSPGEARARALDDRRESDLRALQSGVRRHYQQKGVLPATLDELIGSVPRRDPDTGQAYEYQGRGGAKYELCAVFQTDTRDEPSNDWNQFAVHPAGKHCLEAAATR